MSKKQELAVLDKATVNNNINLNVNQNDLVDLAISEHMTRIEEHLKNVREKLEGVKTEWSEILDKHSKLLANTFIKSNKQIKDIDKILAGANTSVEKALKVSIVNNDRYSRDEADVLGDYKEYNNDIEECSSTRSFESNTRNRQFKHYLIQNLELRLNVKVGIFDISLNEKVNISDKDKAKITKELLEPNTRWYKLVVEKYEVEKEYIKYRFGEKKMKAALIRAALEKSEEGQGILKMLSGVSNIKLLK